MCEGTPRYHHLARAGRRRERLGHHAVELVLEDALRLVAVAVVAGMAAAFM